MKAIKVSNENIQEIWDCPDITELVKTVSGDTSKKMLIVRFSHREYYVPNGWYLIQDDNGSWSVVSPQVYELIKQNLE